MQQPGFESNAQSYKKKRCKEQHYTGQQMDVFYIPKWLL